MNRKHIAAAAAAVVLGAGLTACSQESLSNDTAATDNQLKQYQQAQPVPGFAWSQERATLIALLNARATTTATTTFFYNQGVAAPVASCPSIGMPIATTAQVTNPVQRITNTDAVVDQMEPTGVYTGDSSGTYVLCATPAGVKYPVYWEGFVYTVAGNATLTDGVVALIGEPSVKVEGKK